MYRDKGAINGVREGKCKVHQLQQVWPRKQEDSYVRPSTVTTTTIGELIQGIREIPEQHQARFGITPGGGLGVKIWMAGDSSLVKLPLLPSVVREMFPPQVPLVRAGWHSN